MYAYINAFIFMQYTCNFIEDFCPTNWLYAYRMAKNKNVMSACEGHLFDLVEMFILFDSRCNFSFVWTRTVSLRMHLFMN